MPSRAPRGSASKNAVLGIVIVGALGVAGFLAFQHFSAGGEDAKHLALLNSGREYQQKLSRLFSANPDQFNNVSVSVKTTEPPKKVTGTIEITGRVPDQKAMDALKAILAANPHPADLAFENTVTIGKVGG
ncbi:MAG: hypothetical protein JNK35_00545 [Phycisphaerae bacterium]|nr:hypothetical protein [Phycisphaerae bacterium]